MSTKVAKNKRRQGQKKFSQMGKNPERKTNQ